MSLIEVLASIGVIAVGLLGLASLLPVGQIIIFEANKADRAGNCGRAAMRDVVIRRMLDSNYWTSNPGTTQSYLIDPMGVLNGMNLVLGSTGSGTPVSSSLTSVPRISLGTPNPTSGPFTATPYSAAQAALMFTCTDDLIAPLPENMTPPLPVGRPIPMMNGTSVQFNGDYTWFASVVPTPNNPTRFLVSVVVCYKRILNPASERAVPVTQYYNQAPDGPGGVTVALGGGSILLARPINDIAYDGNNGTAAGVNVREGDWVALCNSSGGCRWYRVAQIGNEDASTAAGAAPTSSANPNTITTGSNQLTLVGPDWLPFTTNTTTKSTTDYLVGLGQNVIGVYTTTIDLDTDPTWKN